MRRGGGVLLVGALLAACAATSETSTGPSGSGAGPGTGGDASGSGGGITVGAGGGLVGAGGGCGAVCSTDLHAVVDCNGNVVEQCTGLEGCDATTGTCANACDAAVNNKQAVGCEYYATFMDQLNTSACFAVFVANTWDTPVHIDVERGGTALPVASFTYVPQGSGPSLSYDAYDATAGLAPGEVAILFLGGPQGTPSQGNPVCPFASAVPSGAMIQGSGVGQSFRITTDVPVVSYQINPYGGGSAAVTGASLLLPTSVWDTNYVGIHAYEAGPHPASMNIVAAEDGTQVTMVPTNAVVGGSGVPSGPANTPLTFTLNRGQHAQLTQDISLSGSVIQADKPIGFMAGARCSFVPSGVYACDHLEQMVPPVQALGSEYVGVMYRPRSGEPAVWRIMGTVDGTTLSYTPDVGGPTTLSRGQVVEFSTGTPFVVKSQDEDHPFVLLAHMSGGSTNGMNGNGDADSVLSTPPAQYMSRYVFFADPTYPETNLVVVRAKDGGIFHDVALDCAGPLGGWQPVGDYEWTRVDLSTSDFQGVNGCSTGRREMTSEGRFGLWVWGWGTPATSTFTSYVSYGYPAGMLVQPINEVVVPPIPK